MSVYNVKIIKYKSVIVFFCPNSNYMLSPLLSKIKNKKTMQSILMKIFRVKLYRNSYRNFVYNIPIKTPTAF